jgi:uncharacterized protein YdeI (BOF family)
MKKVMRLILIVFAASGIALAGKPYQEAETLMPELGNFEGKIVSVHGLIDKIEKDGMSADTLIITLDGGLRCRVSRDAFKNRRLFAFKSGSKNDLKIEYQGRQILNQGTDVIIRGTVKKETNKWVIDRAVIRGCSDSDARNGMDIRCEGPCTQTYRYYHQCGICRDTDEKDDPQ